MKRLTLFALAALAVVVLIGYPATSWFLGSRVETALDEQYKNLNGLLPFIRLSDRKYERGLFTSHETETATLILSPLEPIQFTIDSDIKHGPFSGMFALAAATIDSEVKVRDGFKQDAAEWIGDGKLLSLHTTFRLDGNGGDTTISMPAINTPGMSWDRMTLTVNFSKGVESYTLHGDIPRGRINFKAGTQLQIAGVHFDSAQKRAFDDESLLFDGTNKVTIAKINLEAAAQGIGTILPTSLVIQQLTLDDISVLNNGEFIDYASKLGAEVIKVGDQDYGPAHLDSSFRHLHARTFANLYRAYLENQEKNPSRSLSNVEFVSSLSTLTQELINHNAEFRLDRLSFTRPQGEALLSATVKFRDTTSSDFANRQALLSKLYANIDIRIPEDLLPPLLQTKFATPEQAVDRVKAGVAALVAQGYATQESGTIISKLEFHDGEQWFNGKQIVQPVVNVLMENPSPDALAQTNSGMPESARRLNCTACHSIDRKVVGPSWMDVSRKYKNASGFIYQGRQYSVEDGLLMKISRGGSGNWGPMPMPAIDAMGHSQSDIRGLVRFILGVTKTESTQFRQVEVVPPFIVGESLETFLADTRSRGISGAVIDPHNKTAGGENTSVSYAASGIRLFFSNGGQRNLKIVRFDPPYSGKQKGIGIGDNLFQINNTLGSPVRPPWRYANYKAYLFNGEDNSYVRFDLSDGVVKTIFVMKK
jgi:uncharacterized protein YdgA (DUF945 family)/cytochrome c551/c552